MKITLAIPEKLIKEAMELTGAKNKNQATKGSLEELIARIKRKRLITMKGTIDLGIDLDEVRKR